MQKKHIIMGIVAAVILLLGAFIIFAYSQEDPEVQFIAKESGLHAQLAEPAWVSDSIVGVLPGAFVPRDPSVYNQSKKAIYVALRIEILTGAGELLSPEQADMFFRLITLEEAEGTPWRLVIPSERDEASQIWVYCGGGDEPISVAAESSTQSLFSGLRFASNVRSAERNWLEGSADLRIEKADGTVAVLPALEKGFQIRYTGALISAAEIDSLEQDVNVTLYEMLKTI